jgi:uncharacterized protein YkwD
MSPISRARTIFVTVLALSIATPVVAPAAATAAKKKSPKAHVVGAKKGKKKKARKARKVPAKAVVKDRTAATRTDKTAAAKPTAAPVVPTTCSDADVQLAPSAENIATVSVTTICLVNRERGARGLKPLALQSQLSAASLGFSADMVRESFFSHVSPDGRDMVDRLSRAGYIHDNLSGWNVGENIGWGTGSYATPAEMVKAWMDSPGHRDNILKKDYREIGIGVVLGVPSAGLTGGATYTTDFGARND